MEMPKKIILKKLMNENFKEIYSETWTRKRCSESEEILVHSIDYFIEGTSKKKGEVLGLNKELLNLGVSLGDKTVDEFKKTIVDQKKNTIMRKSIFPIHWMNLIQVLILLIWTLLKWK